MIRQFDDSDCSFGIYARYSETITIDSITVLGVETIIAAKFLRHLFLLIHPVSKCVWHYLDGLGLANKRATHFAD